MSNLISQDLPAPDTDHASRLEGGLGAPPREHSSATLSTPHSTPSSPNNELGIDQRPDFSTIRRTKSSQLAIESEAEEDFESRSPSVFRRPKSLHEGGSSRHSGRASASPTLRRSSVVDAMNLQHDEYPSFSGSTRARRISSGITVSPSGGALDRHYSGASNPSTPAKLISRLRKRTFPRLPKFGRRGQRQNSDDEERYDQNDGTLGRISPLAIPDAWSSDSSLEEGPAFEIDNSLENATDSQDEDILGLQSPSEQTRSGNDDAPQQDQ